MIYQEAMTAAARSAPEVINIRRLYSMREVLKIFFIYCYVINLNHESIGLFLNPDFKFNNSEIL